jgi:oxygen-independent coproporphyrinogen III oxidase
VHLYIHVPFCARRCSYCDFAIAVRRRIPSNEFVSDVLHEWRQWQSHAAWDASPGVATIYFGGGTPSRLDPSGIARIIDAIVADRRVDAAAEITLEANPDDVTVDAAATWHRAGVNRLSIGAQSFDPSVLSWMHRTHTDAQIATAVEIARAAGIAELSLDLIFGLPAALERDWARDLQLALSLEPEHLSLYGLTVEEHTPVGRWAASGRMTPVDETRYAAEFLAAHQAMTSAGYDHYEVSNAGKPGHRGRHNSAYWRRAPFIGLGPSAHSGFGAQRSWNIREWQAYHAAACAGEPLEAGREELNPNQVALEEVYLGLRTREGLPASRLPENARTRWANEGWARPVDDRIILTPEGWLRLDALAASIG